MTVNDTRTAQTWEGFGGAFNEMGWNVLSMLSPATATRPSSSSTAPTARASPSAASRSAPATTRWIATRSTRPPDDTTLASFSIARDMEKLIPFVKAAQAVKGNIRFWASPWTPPTWMKQGPFSPGNAVSPFDGGTMKSDDATMAAFAQYLIKFVQAYAQQGIAVEAISPQNEPNYTGNYPTCGWSPATYTKFVGQYLGPAVADAGLPTKIMLGTFNGGGSDHAIVGSVMADAGARDSVRRARLSVGHGQPRRRRQAVQPPDLADRAQVRQLPVGRRPSTRAMAPNDQAYAVESWGLIRDWIKAGVTAYSAWNMVLDTVGVGIDTTRVWPQNALLDGRHRDEDAERHAGLLRLPPPVAVRRAGREGRGDQRRGRPGVQEPGRRRRHRHVQRRPGADDDRGRARQEAAISRCPATAGPPVTRP